MGTFLRNFSNFVLIWSTDGFLPTYVTDWYQNFYLKKPDHVFIGDNIWFNQAAKSKRGRSSFMKRRAEERDVESKESSRIMKIIKTVVPF